MSDPVNYKLAHLKALEAESIHIIREVAAEFERPVLFYSIGKDSTVMLRLAQKAFYPGRVPFPLLHVDTTWEFREMYEFRDRFCREQGLDLRVWINPEGQAQNINPFDHGSKTHTDIMKTVALKQALNHYQFDAAFGGARRDEEKSRAKERVYSFRFRTLGCYPLTGAIESTAATLPEIIEEMLVATNSERQGRVIDHDEAGSMELKKRDGYF